MQSTFIQKITINEMHHIQINYVVSDTCLGKMLVASAPKRLFYTGFADLDVDAFADLKKRIPQTNFMEQNDAFQQQAIDFLNKKTTQLPPFYLKGSDFQLSVWEELLKIPLGQLVSYQHLASQIGKPKACRAVGSAIGKSSFCAYSMSSGGAVIG